MNITDYLVIAAVIISAGIGSYRGFLREAVALATWFIALFVAWHFSDVIEPHLGGVLAVFVILGQLLHLDEERWWSQSVLIPYGASIANGLRMLVGEERVRHAARVTVRA